MDTTTYDVPGGYTVVVRRRRSYAGRIRWLMLGPTPGPNGMRPIVSVGHIDPLRPATPDMWIALGFAPPAALAELATQEKSPA